MNEGFHMGGPTLPPLAWTFDGVQERLIEALQLLARMPDRERGWLSSGTSSLWRMVQRDLVDGAADDEPRVRSGLTSVEVDRMNEALAWVEQVDERDRKLVGLAVGQLARGAKRVSWRAILPQLGLRLGADGLRMRYGRAITLICQRLNAAENRAPRVSISEN